ncbi:unnamed protein product [Caenorhabditis brenneri]
MNRRTLCILLVLIACFSIAFAKKWEDLQAKELGEGSAYAELEGSAAEEPEGIAVEEPEELPAEEPDWLARKGSAEGSADLNTPEKNEKKTDESATPAKGAPATGSFFTIGALTMTAVYIA